MPDKVKIMISSFQSKELKEFVCVCGRRDMKYTKIFEGDMFGSDAIVECKTCGESRQVKINYPEEITDEF